MASRESRHRCAGVTLLLSALISGPAFAATKVDVVKADLDPLIRAAIVSKVQFAVAVPHVISSASDGNWAVTGSSATWRYAVRIPTAVSVSFHATRIHLPAAATLTVRSAVTTITYRAENLRSSELWSRIQPGDALDFTLKVPSADRAETVLEIQSLQAGYRSLGAGVNDHPTYRRLRAQDSTSDSGCVQNYQCNITATNTGPGQATVGLTIGNLYQCTGVLINDVPGDNTPYVLTARHCESGVLGGGNPGAAGTIIVYWDAVTPCGQALGSLYDPSVATQTGATTAVEQQDAWLVQLAYSPVVKDAYFAGFDATGGPVQGGYTVHHALGLNKQFAEWFGQAASVQLNDVLTSTYLSQFLEVVNGLGNVGPGASGSGLIDQNNHLVGSLTLGRTSGDASGYESCPVSPPTAPNGSNGVADFTSLAAVWNSRADGTSTTGSATIKSTLDPASTGVAVVASAAAANVTFASSAYSASSGTSIMLKWDASNASQCIAAGGVSGDGWTGTLASSGNLSVAETLGGEVTYKLQCQVSGGRTVGAAVVVTWHGPTPFLYFYTFGFAWAGGPALLTWSSTVGPCSITGGNLALSNLASSGSTTTTQNSTGDVTYTITCGSGITVSQTVTVTFVTPGIILRANSTDRRQGQPLALYWETLADSCVTSGGAPNDGWAGTSFKVLGTTTEFHANTAAVPLGTYTYRLTCSSGPNTLAQSVAVTIEDNPAYATLTVVNPSTTYTATPADYVTINWISNLTDCAWNSSPIIGNDLGTQPIPHGSYFPQDTATIAPVAAGSYVLTVTCSSPAGVAAMTATSAPITVTVLPPAAPTASVSSSASSVQIGTAYTISWTSTSTASCTETGGGDPTAQSNIWLAGQNAGTSGSMTVTPNATGQFTFGIACLSLDPNVAGAAAQAVVTVTQASAPSGPSAPSAPSGPSAPSAPSGSPESSSHGGGGTLSLFELCLLSILLLARRRSRIILVLPRQ